MDHTNFEGKQTKRTMHKSKLQTPVYQNLKIVKNVHLKNTNCHNSGIFGARDLRFCMQVSIHSPEKLNKKFLANRHQLLSEISDF